MKKDFGNFRFVMVSLASALASAILLGGCNASNILGLGNSDKKQEHEKQIQENRDELLQIYAPLKGTFEKASREQEGMNVSVGIFWVNTPRGNDSLSEPIMMPSLRVKVTLLQDELKPAITLEARYQRSVGEIIASGTDGKGPFSLHANINGDTMAGEVFNSNGRLGGFKLTRRSAEVNSESSDQEREFFNLVRARYQRLAGTYAGTLKSNGKIVGDFPVELEINLIELVVNGKAELRLKATYRRPDLPNVGAERFLNMAARLTHTNATDVSLSCEGTAAGSLPESQFLAISGVLNEDTGILVGTLMDWRGQLGEVTLKKK